MVDQRKLAITAIADSRTESFVAASLVRQGWEVIFRALSYPDLKMYMDQIDCSDIPVFLSPDLRGVAPQSERKINREILLNLRPSSDFEIAELLRERDVPRKGIQADLPAHVKVIGFSSIGRGVGTSTLALNLAQELALHGAKTLLIDAHPRSPYLSQHTGLFGLTRGILQAPFQVALLETASPALAVEEGHFDVSEFEYLVVDCGEIYKVDEMVCGRRREDAALQWLSIYGRELIVVREELEPKRQMINGRIDDLGRIAIKPRISHLINKCDPAARKKSVINPRESSSIEAPSIFTRDARSTLLMERERSTLAQSAPKSQLRHQLIEFATRRNWWRD